MEPVDDVDRSMELCRPAGLPVPSVHITLCCLYSFAPFLLVCDIIFFRIHLSFFQTLDVHDPISVRASVSLSRGVRSVM